MSKETRQTEGPWQRHHAEIRDKDDATVALICSTDANARLIAAAPELLEAAKELLATHGDCLYDVLNPCGGAEHWGGGEACETCKLRAAVVKATG